MTATTSLSIGVLARRTGCTVPTIRYYESIGLLPPGPRTASGHRIYGQDAVRRLGFIRRCRDFGFALDEVRELIDLVDHPDRPCVEMREIAARHLQQVRARLADLHALEADMAAFVRNCDAACVGGTTLHCTIVEDLSMPDRVATATVPRGCCAG
jgi:DNA-binding transcriptional MerR regulator